jgi:orotidine-5'-phosphate decarboxylase
MLERAVAGARAGGSARVLAVTVLTSLGAAELAADGAGGTVEELVLRRARLAREVGCDGVVASPKEAAAVRQIAASPFLIVTPGVRQNAAAADDQERVASVRAARQAGADLVVVGRPIRDAADPRAAVAALVEELA